jgi:serine protease Do
MNSKMDDLMARLRRQKFLSVALMLFTLATGIVIGTVITHGVKARDQVIAPGATPLSIPPPAALAPATQMFVNIAKAVRPAVVNINTSATIRRPTVRRSPRDNSNDQNPFQDFLDQWLGQGMPQGDIRQRSLGSGVIVDPNGYILTNRHVVERADRIQVKLLNDPKLYDAKVIGSDTETDIAVIKIDPRTPLQPAKIGNSDGMNVGDWVLAVGSPFGLQETVTAGIVSAKGRDVQGAGQFQHFIQTDAAINPGNSGGPLVNMAGEVIGISTMIATGDGNNAGVGFALPSNTAVQVYNQIIKTGKVSRGSIGINFLPEDERTPALLRSFGVSEGVVVNSVVAGSPAEKAGLKEGDVLVAIDGQPVQDGNDLVDKISTKPIGSKVRVRYMRYGEAKPLETTVTIADRAELFAEANRDTGQTGPQGRQTEAKFGLTLSDLTPEMARQLRAPSMQGCLVSGVEPNSFAEDVNIREGDIIVELQHQPVRSVDDLRRIQRTLKSGDAVVFKVMRRDPRTGQLASLFLAGDLP